MADEYILSVTAGPNYEDQNPIGINTEEPTRITSSHLTASLRVRIQNYRGLPKDSPKTSPYFSHPKHEKDLYSLSFTVTPKEDLNGHDLVFGNDFDHPIRDKLPPGFNQAFKIATWFIDPGLYGDVYADEPYLYGPLLSSINVLRIGPKDDREQEKVEEVRANEELLVFEEGADGDGEQVREELGMPHESAARQKHFLQEGKLKDFTFEKGREYSMDFYNPYLDFNDFSLKLPAYGFLPGINIPVLGSWASSGQQPLRYVLKNRKTDEPLFVVVFTLLPKEEVAEGEKPAEVGGEKEEAAISAAGGGDDELD
ncbi:hypothetical protein M409DRAFT_29380 [Zasmidium cellare ATCC 36951]|uniref:Domain of unknown function at the cortex 1 domain-containing protein n=1 Tax=Zasmidium cellare ATCC 36951 TaxID=1080233 RepID=A0A6A6BZ72_ZASCE|nr:uncharacterized protein M409DRAFT_29380 [Zasmidium cellare ATCC 36951]KAF2160081.1 hypothetical protein M409DRAFT_29380 [Zasmidium cellare ATCC 36951]